MTRDRGTTAQSGQPPARLGRPAVLAAILFLLGALLYANTLANEWALDDDLVYNENSFVLQGLRGIPGILSTDV